MTWNNQNFLRVKFSKFCVHHKLLFSGSEDEKVEFCFEMYDLNEDGFISRDEMLTLLGNCLLMNRSTNDFEAEEGVKVSIVAEKIIRSFLQGPDGHDHKKDGPW